MLIQVVVVAGAQAATINVPADRPTIQQAVDSPDVDSSDGIDTVAVAAGTYPERVTVTEPVVIQGTGGPVVGTSAGGFEVSSADVTISGFTIAGDGTGVGINVTTPGAVAAHMNRFVGNSTAISAEPGGSADATNNWFGCNAGPGGAGCQPVAGAGVTATPFLLLSVSASPDAVDPGGTAGVAASLRVNSAGIDLGAIAFPASAIAFATTLGSITPSAALDQGRAGATFTAPASSGTATVSATLDNATVSRDIRVLRPDGDGDGIADDVDCAPADASKPAKGVADVDCDGQVDKASAGTTIKLVLNTLTGTSRADKISGTDAAELLLGLAGDDLLRGRKGNDRIFGGDGQDRVYGDTGEDRVNGGGGDDRVEGGSGADLLEGSAGRDKLVGGGGSDVLVGGSGADTITAHGGDDTARGGSGNDKIDARDGERGDIVSCGPGTDRAVVDRGDVVAADCDHVARK